MDERAPGSRSDRPSATGRDAAGPRSDGRDAVADGGRVVVPVSDRESLRAELARFAGDAFRERSDGTFVCDFGGVTHLTVLPDGRVDAGMPLHAFDGTADRVLFDHDREEVTFAVDTDEETLSYTFRRP